MNDIFADADLGGGNESVLATDAPVEQPSTQAIPDSPAAAEPLASTDGLATTADQGAEVQDGTQQQQPPATEPPAPPTPEQVEAEEAKLEQEVEAALADERTPKWFKNYVENVSKPKIAEAMSSVEQYSQFGTAEEIGAKIELLNGLETIRSNPATGMPERTTEPFVKSLYDKDPQGAYQLMTDLASLPSPYSQGKTVMQEMFQQIGIDPDRIPDIKNFAANGYQMQASAYPPPDPYDLALIPEHLQPTFAKLDPDTRESVMKFEDAARDNTLEAYRVSLETKEREQYEHQTQEQRASEQKAQEQAQFKSQVDSKGQENFEKAGESVLNTFVESLAKQAGMTKMDSLGIANTFLNALEPTLAGRLTQEALKAEGIEIDPTIQATILQLQEASEHAAYYQITGDQAALAKTVARQVELQERLIAKGNKVISQLALKRNGNVIGQVQQNAAALAQTQNSRHAVAGQGVQVSSNQSPSYDYSEEGYLEQLRASGFGSR